MIQTGLESKVKIQQIIDNQLPDFVRSESPATIDFLKQYYISQEYQGGPVDISDNLDEYLKLDNLISEVVVDSTTLTADINSSDTLIRVSSTKGFPNQYGLLKIDDEIITYTELNPEKNAFVGCVRGFCGITSYHQLLNEGELVFSDSTASSHTDGSSIQNLSSLFLKEFYEKQKYTLTPDLQKVDFAPGVNVGNFIKEIRSLYESKGTEESYRILFNVLYNETPKIINLEDFLIKPSSANYIRREIIIGEVISGDPLKLVGQTIFKENDLGTNATISEIEPFTRSGIEYGKLTTYYKISLFMGYDDSASTIKGDFKITPASKCLESVSTGSSIISVDSTVGFGATGVISAGTNNNIYYDNKTINQFFNCINLDDNNIGISSFPAGTIVRNDDIYFGYESGSDNKVKIRLTGVLTKFEQISKEIDVETDQIITINGLGKRLEQKINVEGETIDLEYKEMSYNEIFANSWIYNTSTRYRLKNDGNINDFSTLANVYSSSLKKGDKIEIIEADTDNIVFGNNGTVFVVKIFTDIDGVFKIKLNSSFSDRDPNRIYDIRRKINYTKSTIIPLEYNKIISDVQNTYFDDENKIAYVASNSLPSEKLEVNNSPSDYVNNITSDVISEISSGLDGYNDLTGKYSIVNFDQAISFLDGDEVVYNTNTDIDIIHDRSGYVIGGASTIGISTESIVINHQVICDTAGIVAAGTTVTNIGLGQITLSNSLVSSINLTTTFDFEPNSYEGLEFGSSYFVGIIIPDGGETDDLNVRQLRLYSSRSFVGTNTWLEFGNISEASETNAHKFTLKSQESEIISPQKLLKKIPLESTINQGNQTETPVGSIGMLINGIEITNYKSSDKIYYGPLESISVLNEGIDYDVINPPQIEVSSSIGTTALVQPVLRGTITKAEVDTQQFDVMGIESLNIRGGNGTASLEPITITRSREIEFKGKDSIYGGGINTTTNELTFIEEHRLLNYEPVIYKSNGNLGIGIGSTPGYLVNNAYYYTNVINNKTIKLFNSEVDAKSGINTVGLGTLSTTLATGKYSFSGIHKFSTLPNQLSVIGIKVNDGGTFTNRKLIVKPSGISTSYNTVSFKNHGFNDGEIIEYSTTGTPIDGLVPTTGIVTTANQYKIAKIDDDSFKLCDVGIAGTINSNYTRKKYVGFNSTGIGYQNFSYPDISITLNYIPVGLGTTTQTIENIIITPTIKGNIIDAYVYETGTGYGSSVLNFEKKPIISIKNGKDAQLKPIIVDGKINSINLQYGGGEYYSIPDLNIIDPSGEGTGAQLRPIITNNRVSDVEVINAGIGYSSDTYINVVSRGINALLSGNIRSLSINTNERYNNGSILLEGDNNLGYSVCGFDQTFRDSFNEESTTVSKIIGWAYDGNPIYGPYGYSDPKDNSSTIKRIESSYVKNSSNVVDRPSINDFPLGFFVEDYKFTNNGDLDRNNGRFGKTQEFPNGTYAYFATISENNLPEFPYFIGNSYRSVLENQNITQSFDFLSSNLLRNTFPYRVSDRYVDNDFIIETNEISRQKSIIESVTSGSIDKISIISAGKDYKINDLLDFDSSDTGGTGLLTKVSSIEGRDIVDVNTEVAQFDDVIFTWSNDSEIKGTILPYHNLEDNDNIIISGFSTIASNLNGLYSIGITTSSTYLTSPLKSSTVGLTTEVGVANIPSTISIGSSLTIGTETLEILDIYKDLNLLRVVRGSTGVAHTVTSSVSFLSDSFTVSKQIKNFDSLLNNKVYFNPQQSIGFGTISGISSSMTFKFDDNNITVNVPTQRIYIENHSFVDNQKITFTKPSTGSDISISTTSDPAAAGPLPSTLFVSNTGKNTIGIKTGVGIGYSDVYFVSGGSDDDTYLFESNFNQLTGIVNKVISTVSVSTSHNLRKGDQINLNIKPSLSVGIGTSSYIDVEKQNNTNYILINPIGFNSTGINTEKNEISFGTTSHGLNTGDKIFYSSDLFPQGISSSSYYVYKVNDSTIQLADTLSDLNNTPPTIIGIGSTGGNNQSIKLINPSFNVIKNNNLVFNLSNSSLAGYELKLYYDNEFKNEFVSTASTVFNVVSIGTIGVSPNATFTLNYNDNLPLKLYYNLEKSGFINTADISVLNHSEINFVDSDYNSSYNIISIGNTTFDISLNKIPERLSYKQSECSELKYTTKSLTDKGGINKVSILSGGIDYKKLPTFIGSSSTEGSNANILPHSKSIGNVNKVRVINEGFEYSSDKTLQPSAYISPSISIKNFNKIGIITVTSGGSDYIYSPSIDIIDSVTREKISDGNFEVELSGSSVYDLKLLAPISGLTDNGVELFATNNSNGVGINTIGSNSTSTFDCWVGTPKGFNVDPFKTGDEVFIEGITKLSTEGSGFNSSELGYKFGKVTDYIVAGQPGNIGAVLDLVKIDVTGLSTNTGIAVTDQKLQAFLIKKDKYPIFTVSTELSTFNIGEKIVHNNVERDLIITHSNGNYIKVSGSYIVSIGDIIIGKDSGSVATINTLTANSGRFSVTYMNMQNIGWFDDIGKLNLDTQVTPDNDYYQNLSYAVQSSRTFDQLRSPVNSLLHISGLKNFSNTGITSTSNIGIGSTAVLINIQDFIGDLRVDTINDYDYAFDLGSDDISNSIKLKTKKLADYTLAKSNEVLIIDDIKKDFSNLDGEPSIFLDLLKVDGNIEYRNLLVRVSNLDNTDIQMNRLVLLNNGTNKTLFEANDLEDENNIADYELVEDEFGVTSLRFIPKPNGVDYDYDIKVIETKFDGQSGIGTESIGFIDLTASAGLSTVDSTVGITTTTIIGVDSNKYKSFYVNNQLINNTTGEMNYVDVYVVHDDEHSYISEYFTDTQSERDGYSSDLMGSFKADLQDSGFSLSLENTSSDEIKFRSNIVGFGTTTIGIGTYRFLVPNQPPESERSAIYQSNYLSGTAEDVVDYSAPNNVNGISTVAVFDKNLFNAVSSIVEVGIGTTSGALNSYNGGKALYNIIMTHDGTNTYVQQGPFLSAGNAEGQVSIGASGEGNYNVGFGTFGSKLDGDNFVLNFYPDNINTLTISPSQMVGGSNGPNEYPHEIGSPVILRIGSVTADGAIINSDIPYVSGGAFDSNRGDSGWSGYWYMKPTGGTGRGVEARLRNRTSDSLFQLVFVDQEGINQFGTGYIGHYELEISSYHAAFYTDMDVVNTPNIIDLIYGTCTNSIKTYAYNAINGKRINRRHFELKSNSVPIFAKSFDPSDSSVINLGTGEFSISNHFFRTNEELVYTPKSTFVGVGSTPMEYHNSTAGITSTLPSTVFAIRNNADSFSISTTRAGTAVTFVGVGTGNDHEFSMALSNTKSIITVDNLIQSPLAFTPINHTLKDNIDNTNTGISTSRTVFALSGISSIFSGNVLKIDNEYMKVENVGFGTTTVGPITGIGTTTLVEVKRGFVGTSATSHTNSTVARIYKGSYNIVGKQIHFTEAPRGNPQIIKTPSNLSYPTSDFNGRVYLRNNYDTNQVYDDISHQFTGIGQTFNLTVGGANTVGLGTSGGNGLLTISNIFQSPTSINNPSNNFIISEDITSGVSSVTFTGIKTSTGEMFISDSDVNQNELPRGGLIVSLGSTPGIGYALAQSALAYLEKDANGTINKIVGLATTGPAIGVKTSRYDNNTGLLEVVTESPHNFESGIVNQVKLVGLEFTCGGTFDVYDAYYDPDTGDLELTIGDHYLHAGQNVEIPDNALTFTCAKDSHVTEHTYPRATDPISGVGTPVTSTSNSTVTINVGPANDVTAGIHTFVSAVSNALEVKSGYSGITTYFFPSNSNVGVGSTSFEFSILDTAPGYYTHKFISATSTAINGSIQPTGADYNSATGDLTFTKYYHGLVTGSTITIANNSLTFTCSRDGYGTEHTYPRPGIDPVSGISTIITSSTEHTLTVNVGKSQTENRFVTNVGINSIPHTYVGSGSVMAWYGDATYGSGYYGNVSVAVTDIPYTHQFVSGVSTTLYKTSWTGTAYTASSASYDPSNGDLVLTIPSHDLTVSDSVGIRTGSLIFSCSKDNYESQHPYPRSTDPVGGEIIGINSTTSDTVTLNVGASVGSGANITAEVGIGGTLSFSLVGGGTTYNNPQLVIPEASYAGLGITGISRLGEGATTDTGFGLLLDVEVGGSSTVGAASTYFEVTKWNIARHGYGFRKGDVFGVVGLVTDSNLTEPQAKFELTVLDTYTDAFSAWQFGQFNYIDTIKPLQDGNRTRFELRYDDQLLSFEADDNIDYPKVNLSNALLILVNGIIQEPGKAYNFTGGTSFVFTEPPEPEDDVAIFFYRGTTGEDSTLIQNIYPSIKKGDIVQLDKIDNLKDDQNSRTVGFITSVDMVETNLYKGPGITNEEKTLNWTKQKTDKVIDGDVVSIARDSLESLIFPTAKIIGSIESTDTVLYVDDATFFDEEGEVSTYKPGGLIVNNDITPVAAAITAIVSDAGTISSLDIVNGGIGYTAAPSIAIGIPTTGIVIGAGADSSVETVWRVESTGTGHWWFTGGDWEASDNVYDPTLYLIRGQRYTFQNRGVGVAYSFRIQSTPNGSLGPQYNDGVTNNDAAINEDLIFDVPSDAPNVLYYQCVPVGIMGGVINISDTGPNGTATAVSTIDSNGTITSTNITYSGLGYTTTTPPQVLVLPPAPITETITNINSISGSSGIITGISTATGIGVNMGLKFFLRGSNSTFLDDLNVNDPILISNTHVGTAVTSIYILDSDIVGIGTTFVDNVYNVSAKYTTGTLGIITCNIISDTSLVGIASTGDTIMEPVGKFSWGKLSGFTRSSDPISIAVTGKTDNVGLSSFPTIQRRGVGLRDTGALKPFYD